MNAEVVETRERDYSQFFDNIGLVLPENETFSGEDLAALIELGSGMRSSASWIQGDAVLIAKKWYGDEWYSHLSHRVDYNTCMNYATVAGKFPRHRRHANLSFSHHDAVKALEPDLQDEYLNMAEAKQMTRDELRQVVRKAAVTERKTAIGHVGIIDDLLKNSYGLPDGYEVKIVFEVKAA